MKEKVAIIDIGSSTIRFVMYEKILGGRHFKEIENIKRASRLRTYLDEQQTLSEEGIFLLVETLQSFQKILDLYGISALICVATATIRQAKNQEEIVQLVQEKTGLTINLLSDYEEAYYGYLAAANSVDITEGITMDMGGGSTELTYFCDRKLVDFVSLPFGALSLKLQFIKGEIPTDEELLQIRQYFRSELANLPWIFNKNVPIILMGGSARSVAELHQSFIGYPLAGLHHYEMNLSDILDIKEKIKPLSITELQNTEGLSKDRADTILPAIEFFEILCEISNASKIILSRKGLREGVLYGKWNMVEQESHSLVDTEIQALMNEYNIESNKGKQLAQLAEMLFKQIRKINGIGNSLTDDDLALIKRGACIFYLGKSLNEEYGPYAFFLLANRQMVGLSHRDRVKLALIASFKSRGVFRRYIEPFKDWYTKEERKKLCLLGAILKLSQSLNTTERNIVDHIKITSHEDYWVMDIQTKSEFAPEQYQLEKQKKHMEKLLKITLVSEFELINDI